jgi:hypothetical protein
VNKPALYDPLPVATNFVEPYRTGNYLLRLRLWKSFGSGSGSGSGSKSGTGSRPFLAQIKNKCVQKSCLFTVRRRIVSQKVGLSLYIFFHLFYFFSILR